MWDWLFHCLYRLSKLVEIQMINCISKKFTPPAHARPESPLDLLDPTGATYDAIDSQTEQLKGRSPVCINMSHW